ncbi:MAG: CotH kinase family protein [Bacteroidales bacterium]|nr:CotH kinase family protein [Bacteroidales bacterium]
MKRLLPLFVIFFGLHLFLDAQPAFPGINPVFTDTIVPRIDISIDPADLDAIYDNVESDIEYPATFIFKTEHISDTVYEVGFRLRGNTSRHSGKKSFKISFNTFNPGRKYHGLEKMNLNGEHNDPSIMRSKLSWDLLRTFELPAARSNHIQLYINGTFWGIYANVEHIDEEFMEKRFGNQDGNLYKCLWPADLKYIGSDPDLYKFTAGDRRAYDLRTNVEGDDYSDIAHLIDIINNTDLSQLPCELEKIFNVPDYIKTLAFDVVISNWDGYAFNMNNFYLYHNTSTDKFEFVLYDLDNTYGIDWFDIDWAVRNIYSWSPGSGERPLFDRIMEVQQYKDQYSFYVQQLIQEILNTSTLFPRINYLRDQISPLVPLDPFYPLDYGYNQNDFLRSFHEATGAHVKYGLKPYLLTRIGSANLQLENNPIVPVLKYLDSNHPRMNDSIVISAHVESDTDQTIVELIYSMDGETVMTKSMLNNGLTPDITSIDSIYTTSVTGFNQAGTFYYQVRVKKPGDTFFDLQPCDPIPLSIFESLDPDLVLNEFMAGNDATIMDDFGEYDDWVEVYNADPEPVWLGDKYLTDDLNQPQRWLMPDTIIDSGGFFFIWADDDNRQGKNHTNFRLSKGGEELAIMESEDRNSTVIDYLEFGTQTDDISFGRETDGGNLWIPFDNTTPGYSNLSTSSPLQDSGDNPLKVYPNPFTHGVLFLNKNVSVFLFDISGRNILQMTSTSQIDLTDFPAGLYILRTTDGESVKIIKH